MQNSDGAPARANPRPAWWKLRGRSFLATIAITSLAVVAFGWVTGLRGVMHAAFLSVATVALLPFLVTAGAMLLVMGTSLMAALATALAGEDAGVAHASHGAGERVLGRGRWFATRYYRFVGRQRHPFFWGVPAGVLLGGLVLWALIGLLVLPGEARTVRILGATRAEIDRVYRASGELPRADNEGHLSFPEGDARATPVVVDGFGRPVRYEVAGRWKMASWVLVSPGFDGTAGNGDDLCIAGATKLAEWVGQAGDLARVLKAIVAGTASMKDELAGIGALRCPVR